jgi:hypothetical protein
MNPDQPADQESERPVAYGADGKPLYARPAPAPDKDEKPAPQVVYMARPVDPITPVVSPEVEARHKESQRLYPQLNLSVGEYVISAVRRHPIGLIIPMAIGTIVIALVTTVLINYQAFADQLNLTGLLADPATMTAPLLLFDALIAVIMFVVYYVYVNNKFFLTNESVIQEIQVSLFSRLEQTVSLSNIEDASYTQLNILQLIFNYGSIRLSTEGDETTYRFTFVANPKMHIETLNNAIEAFKNGRPTDPNEDD